MGDAGGSPSYREQPSERLSGASRPEPERGKDKMGVGGGKTGRDFEKVASTKILDEILRNKQAFGLQDSSAAENILDYDTLCDIVLELLPASKGGKSGKDQRSDEPSPFTSSIKEKKKKQPRNRPEDIRVGDIFTATIRNVTDYGAYMDLGVGTDGFLHTSQWPKGDNGRIVRVNGVCDVRVGDVKYSDKWRISLELA